MNVANIDRDTALRIALAARSLPDTDLSTLIEVLNDRLGTPLDLDKLARITVTDLKAGIGSLDGEEDSENTDGMDRGGLEPIKLAVRILWGETSEDDSLPRPAAYAEDDMPGSIRVAIASNSGANLDGHFGSCLRFLVYQVSAGEIRLIDIRSAAAADHADDKNLFRVDLIRDCQVLYVVSVGGPAAAKIVRADIHPMKKLEGGPAEDVLADLQQVIRHSPPPWLAKILGISREKRFRRYTGAEEA